MRQKLKSSVLLEYIWNKELSQELRAALVSLLFHIHIDSKPRTERIVPLKTKKFILCDGKTPTKKRNPTNILQIDQNSEKSPEFQMKKEKKIAKLHDVVLDITKIHTITKTFHNKIKEKHQEKKEYSVLQDSNEGSSARPLQKEEDLDENENEYKLELIEEFLKEEESIDEEQIKGLKLKIIEFLNIEIFKKPKTSQKAVQINQNEGKGGIIKDNSNTNKENVNFDVLLLNMVQMIRKMVVCECFAFQEKKFEPNSPQKRNFLSRPVKIQQTHNEFERLIKCLIIILEHQARPTKKTRPETEKLKNPAGMMTNLFGKINNTIQDATETVKNVATNLGQIFFRDATVKNKKNKKKKRTSFMKLDSVSNFYICGMNVKKKFLKNLNQNDYENYDVILVNFWVYSGFEIFYTFIDFLCFRGFYIFIDFLCLEVFIYF